MNNWGRLNRLKEEEEDNGGGEMKDLGLGGSFG